MSRVVQHPGGVLRQLQFDDPGRGAHEAAVARGLAVLEDRSPGEGRDLAHSHRLREQHRGVGVVAGSEIHESKRHEQLVAVVAGFQRPNELGPDDLDQHSLDETARASILRVHREDHQVAQPIQAVLLRLERVQRVEEVRDAEAGVGPAREVPLQRGEVGGVVREVRGEFADRAHDRSGVHGGGRAFGLPLDRAVLRLRPLHCDRGVLQPEPRGMRGQLPHGTAVLDDLGFSGNRVRSRRVDEPGHDEPPIVGARPLRHGPIASSGVRSQRAYPCEAGD